MRICRKTKQMSDGFTLIETIIVLLLLTTLIGVIGFISTAGLHAWNTGYIHAGIREDVSYAMEKIVRDLKETANDSLERYSSIDHTIQFNDLDNNTYVLYLYNANDLSFDSAYSESLYDLRKAGIPADDPASGEGTLILRDVVSPDASPPATALTIDPNGTLITLDFVVQRSGEKVRTRTKIRPRNL